MELKLQNGDYLPDGVGGLRRVSGPEELLQRALFRLTARRGQFPFLADLGSRLWQLGRLPASQRQAAAVQYVTEALAPETALTVESVTLGPLRDGALTLSAELSCQGQTLPLTLEIH